MTERVFLVRHGETDTNQKGVFRGPVSASDPLTERGWAQARAAGDWLAAQALGDPRVYSSTYLRAKQTAQAIAEALGVPVAELDGLHEADVGRWAGRPYAEMAGALASAPPDLTHEDGTFGFPGGESVQMVMDRTRRAFDAAAEAGGTPILVSHGFALRALLCGLLGVDPRTAWREDHFAHPNAGITELRRADGGWELHLLAHTP